MLKKIIQVALLLLALFPERYITTTTTVTTTTTTTTSTGTGAVVSPAPGGPSSAAVNVGQALLQVKSKVVAICASKEKGPDDPLFNIELTKEADSNVVSIRSVAKPGFQGKAKIATKAEACSDVKNQVKEQGVQGVICVYDQILELADGMGIFGHKFRDAECKLKPNAEVTSTAVPEVSTNEPTPVIGTGSPPSTVGQALDAKEPAAKEQGEAFHSTQPKVEVASQSAQATPAMNQAEEEAANAATAKQLATEAEEMAATAAAQRATADDEKQREKVAAEQAAQATPAAPLPVEQLAKNQVAEEDATEAAGKAEEAAVVAPDQEGTTQPEAKAQQTAEEAAKVATEATKVVKTQPDQQPTDAVDAAVQENVEADNEKKVGEEAAKKAAAVAKKKRKNDERKCSAAKTKQTCLDTEDAETKCYWMRTYFRDDGEYSPCECSNEKPKPGGQMGEDRSDREYYCSTDYD